MDHKLLQGSGYCIIIKTYWYSTDDKTCSSSASVLQPSEYRKKYQI